VSVVYQCDRCKAISGEEYAAGYIPEDWRNLVAQPVRGSEGARSMRSAIICDACDDDLYEWWVRPKEADKDG
jgi:hypothetical protein